MSNKFKNYDEFFYQIGLSEKESQSKVLAFVRELFAIAIQQYNNEIEAEEDLA